MNTPSKEEVLSKLQEYINVDLHKVPKRRLFYSSQMTNGKKIMICTPKSKLHVRGHGWTDLTTTQISILEEADYALVAFRMEGGNIYYVDFSKLRKFLTEDALMYNSSRKNHWKLYLWPTHIQIRGNDRRLDIEPNSIEDLEFLRNTN